MDVAAGLRRPVDPWIDAAVSYIAIGKELGVPAHEVPRLAEERPGLVEGAVALIEARNINQRLEAEQARHGRGR